MPPAFRWIVARARPFVGCGESILLGRQRGDKVCQTTVLPSQRKHHRSRISRVFTKESVQPVATLTLFRCRAAVESRADPHTEHAELAMRNESVSLPAPWVRWTDPPGQLATQPGCAASRIRPRMVLNCDRDDEARRSQPGSRTHSSTLPRGGRRRTRSIGPVCGGHLKSSQINAKPAGGQNRFG